MILAFCIGLFIGAIIGFAACVLCVAASRADEDIEREQQRRLAEYTDPRMQREARGE